MPQKVYPAFMKMLFELFNGTATRPATLYMGLTGSSGEIAGGGYARRPITVNSTNFPDQSATSVGGYGGYNGLNGWQIAIPTQSFPAFTAIPSPNTADTWFLADTPTGYNYLVSGPLNPATVTGTLAAASSGQTLLMASAVAAQLYGGDTLNLGSNVLNAFEIVSTTFETVNVVSIGTSDGTNTPVTVTRTGYASTPPAYPHPLHEPFNRDGSTRTYSVGFVEMVSATIQMGQG